MTLREFSVYLPPARETFAWGAVVTSAGHVRTPPGSPYPSRSAGHPADHFFQWERGRVLEAWQVILIHEGRGWFESRPTGRCRVQAGTTFLLFPGLWHRYAPDPAEGWTESWVELEGPAPERLREAGTLDPARALHHRGLQAEYLDAIHRCHVLAQGNPVGSANQLAATALEVLALWVAGRDGFQRPPGPMEEAVRRARLLLVDQGEEPLAIRSLARKVGVGESHLRRTFRAQTGLSPKQYQRELRLRRVRALLRNSALTVTEIAHRLGYNSPYHLSAEFKKHAGVSPSMWRQKEL